MVPRLLVQACEVATCCWAVRAVARRGVLRVGVRRESFLFQGEQCLNQSVCVCARAARPATRCGLDENEYCAALYGVTLPYSERRGCGLPELFWLVALTLHMDWPKDDSPARHCDC